MYLNQLLDSAVLLEEDAADAYVTLLPKGVCPWCDKTMAVPLSAWEQIYIDNRRKEPEVEIVMPAILAKTEERLFTYLASKDAVRKRYSELQKSADEFTSAVVEAAEEVLAAGVCSNVEKESTEMNAPLLANQFPNWMPVTQGEEETPMFGRPNNEEPDEVSEFPMADEVSVGGSPDTCQVSSSCGFAQMTEDEPSFGRPTENDEDVADAGATEESGAEAGKVSPGADTMATGIPSLDSDMDYDPTGGLGSVGVGLFESSVAVPVGSAGGSIVPTADNTDYFDSIPAFVTAVAPVIENTPKVDPDLDEKDRDDLVGDELTGEIAESVPRPAGALAEMFADTIMNSEPGSEEESEAISGEYSGGVIPAVEDPVVTDEVSVTETEPTVHEVREGSPEEVDAAPAEGESEAATDVVQEEDSAQNLDPLEEASKLASLIYMPHLDEGAVPQWALECVRKYVTLYTTYTDVLCIHDLDVVLSHNCVNAESFCDSVRPLFTDFAMVVPSSSEEFLGLIADAYKQSLVHCFKGDVESAVAIASAFAKLIFD